MTFFDVRWPEIRPEREFDTCTKEQIAPYLVLTTKTQNYLITRPIFITKFEAMSLPLKESAPLYLGCLPIVCSFYNRGVNHTRPVYKSSESRSDRDQEISSRSRDRTETVSHSSQPVFLQLEFFLDLTDACDLGLPRPNLTAKSRNCYTTT